MLKKWCTLIIVLLISPLVLAVGSGTQADPFIVTSLAYEGQFVTNGVGHYVSPSININGVNYPTGWLSGKAKVITFSGNLVEGKNTVSIQSNYYQADGCCWSAYCDYVLSAIRVGAATDNNVVYTQVNGWSGTGLREYMEPGGGCTFYKLEEQCEEVYYCNDWCGWTTQCNTITVPVRVDMPYTTQEKCIHTVACGECCQTSLSRDFWVKFCAASETCTTAGDENCNGQCDYDSSTCSHDDAACPVGVTAISVSYVTGKPIIFLGVGQNYGDLEKFDSHKIISSIGL